VSVRERQVERGVPLTVALAVFTVFEVIALASNFLLWRQIVTHGQPDPGVPAGRIVVALLALVALLGVWLWQRKAVYLLAVALAVGAVYDAWFDLAALALLIRLVLIGLLAWCIARKWKSFR